MGHDGHAVIFSGRCAYHFAGLPGLFRRAAVISEEPLLLHYI